MDQLISILETSIGKSAFESIINVWLVNQGVRPGMMMASYDLMYHIRDKQIKCILDFAKQLNLVWQQIGEYRYVIGNKNTMFEFINNDEGIGKALGFQCYDHKFFHDHKRDRYCKNIHIEYNGNKMEIVEAADASLINKDNLITHMNQKIVDFKRVLPDNFIIYGEVKFIPSVWTRFEKLYDLDYVVEHLDEYINDFYNFCEIIDIRKFASIVNNPAEYRQYLPLLKMVYERYVCTDN